MPPPPLIPSPLFIPPPPFLPPPLHCSYPPLYRRALRMRMTMTLMLMTPLLRTTSSNPVTMRREVHKHTHTHTCMHMLWSYYAHTSSMHTLTHTQRMMVLGPVGPRSQNWIHNQTLKKVNQTVTNYPSLPRVHPFVDPHTSSFSIFYIIHT